jgi:hypothetical protein
MMPEVPQIAPSLPTPILLVVAALTGIIVLLALVRLRDKANSFVIGATWLRNVMSAFHATTFKPAVAGMSLNALGSIAVFLLGLVLVRRRHFLLRPLIPIYPLIAIAIVSGVLNQQYSGLITVVTKYGYLIVMMLAVYEALSRWPDRFMPSLLWAFAPPLIYQAFSVVLDVAKRTEIGNSTAFIGGYYHEGAFSVGLTACLMAAGFAQKLRPVVRNGLILICLVGIFLANYRTTFLAILPFLIAYFGFGSVSRFPTKERPLVLGGMIILGSIVMGLATLFLADRFQDMNVAFSGHVNFWKPPNEYSVEETRILSGRPHIWAGYIFGYLEATPLQFVIGLGPESWQTAFTIYAHNTLVSYLYEYGILGVIFLPALWLSMLGAALRVRHPHKGLVVGAHASFLLLNMSTMPMWQIEGNILYAVICGYTLHLLYAPQARTVQTRRKPIRRRPFASAPVAVK